MAFANFQGKEELIKHHIDKNIMKKTEDYIKPVILEAGIVDEKEIDKIKDYYLTEKQMGQLDKNLVKLMRKQKNATTTNGPHPHH